MDFDALVSRVVQSGNCSGCGACALINGDYEMRLTEKGFNRPFRRTTTTVGAAEAESQFLQLKSACPGVRVDDPADPQAKLSDGHLGLAVSCWEGWATDPTIRAAGSSGGVLTAIQAWLLDSGTFRDAVASRADERDPRLSTSSTYSDSSRSLEHSGSRYAPTSNAKELGSISGSTAFVGKPCEASAIRKLSAFSPSAESPLILSFFCAGVPSSLATLRLLESIGVPVTASLELLKYRGDGWPGRFRARSSDGSEYSSSYENSWGVFLGPSVQWRCKICPDGTGRSADIVACDYWKADERGFPVFDDSPGISGVIARTERGHKILLDARDAGVLELHPLDLSSIAQVQPLQTERIETLAARRLGRRLAGFEVPAISGIKFRRFALLRMIRFARYTFGSWRRSRSGGHADD